MLLNWHAFPYCPKVEFAIAHTGDTILVTLSCRRRWCQGCCWGRSGTRIGGFLVVSFLQAQMQMEVTIIWNPTASERFSYVTERARRANASASKHLKKDRPLGIIGKKSYRIRRKSASVGAFISHPCFGILPS